MLFGLIRKYELIRWEVCLVTVISRNQKKVIPWQCCGYLHSAKNMNVRWNRWWRNSASECSLILPFCGRRKLLANAQNEKRYPATERPSGLLAAPDVSSLMLSPSASSHLYHHCTHYPLSTIHHPPCTISCLRYLCCPPWNRASPWPTNNQRLREPYNKHSTLYHYTSPHAQCTPALSVL